MRIFFVLILFFGVASCGAMEHQVLFDAICAHNRARVASEIDVLQVSITDRSFLQVLAQALSTAIAVRDLAVARDVYGIVQATTQRFIENAAASNGATGVTEVMLPYLDIELFRRPIAVPFECATEVIRARLERAMRLKDIPTVDFLIDLLFADYSHERLVHLVFSALIMEYELAGLVVRLAKKGVVDRDVLEDAIECVEKHQTMMRNLGSVTTQNYSRAVTFLREGINHVRFCAEPRDDNAGPSVGLL